MTIKTLSGLLIVCHYLFNAITQTGVRLSLVITISKVTPLASESQSDMEVLG